jgi:hypothetical protein
MGPAIAEVLPAAIGVVLVNPLPIVAVILMLFSPRAASTAPAFAAGWVTGVFAVLALLIFVIPIDQFVGRESDPTPLASAIRIVVGLVLLFLAFQRWRGRPGPGEEKSLPAWTASLENSAPSGAFGLGTALSGLNPKNLAFTLSTAVAIAQADLTTAAALVPIVLFVLLASIGVAAPVIWYFVDQKRAIETMTGWRMWLTANYAVIMTIVFLLFGVKLLTQGLGRLIG